MKITAKITDIRHAVEADLPEIRRIYDSAKQYMNDSGNPSQWVTGYPPQSMLEDDIKKGILYAVCGEDNNRIHAVFAMIPGIDPTYIKIDGEWCNDHPYTALHRVASDGTLRGVVNTAVEYAHQTYPSNDIRIDTHEDNNPMQTALAAIGFVRCGIIYLPNGAPRIAFQLIFK